MNHTNFILVATIDCQSSISVLPNQIKIQMNSPSITIKELKGEIIDQLNMFIDLSQIPSLEDVITFRDRDGNDLIDNDAIFHSNEVIVTINKN